MRRRDGGGKGGSVRGDALSEKRDRRRRKKKKKKKDNEERTVACLVITFFLSFFLSFWGKRRLRNMEESIMMRIFERLPGNLILALVVGYAYVVACVVLPDWDLHLRGKV